MGVKARPMRLDGIGRELAAPEQCRALCGVGVHIQLSSLETSRDVTFASRTRFSRHGCWCPLIQRERLA